MGIFDKVLASNETLFKNEVSLSYDFIPKLLPYREAEQHQIALAIKPLFHDMNGKNAIVYGMPGVGKTVALKKVIQELEETTDDIIPIYVNCWQKNTTYKIFLEICEQLSFKFTQNKRTEELFQVIKKLLNPKKTVFIFDEIDKAEDFSFMYSILEEIYKKTILCITNYKSWISSIDERIMSRLIPEQIEFKPYTLEETKGILQERISLAYHKDVWNADAFLLAVDKTFEQKDIRTGLYLLKESGLLAEQYSSKVISSKEVTQAINKMRDFKVKEITELQDDSQEILQLIKENSPARIGDIYDLYGKAGGKLSYKTFQRRVFKLEESNFIKTKKHVGGSFGTTTMLYYETTTKKLDDFTSANNI